MSAARQTAATSADEFWMRKAIALARMGEGWTRPNPPVGALLVKRGKQVGSGYHRSAGKGHAEVNAIKAAGTAAAGSTLYVTLEPCSTHGRTPPCCSLIEESRVSRVVVALRDPNPRHAGRGLRILRRGGIDVSCGVLQEQARELIAPFKKWVEQGRPYITLKMAMTLDGRIADARGRSRWITSDRSRNEVEGLRRRADVVMVGSNTACLDDPSLLCKSHSSSHYRLIVDGEGRLGSAAQVLTDSARRMTIVATTEKCPLRSRDAFKKSGCELLILPTKQGRVSLKALMRELGRRGMLHVLCEGGAGLAHALLRQKLVDECWFFVAPLILGAQDALPVVYGKGWDLARARRLRFTHCERVGVDMLLKAVPEG